MKQLKGEVRVIIYETEEDVYKRFCNSARLHSLKPGCVETYINFEKNGKLYYYAELFDSVPVYIAKIMAAYDHT